ncbi:MAG: LbtU family siderophore porin [Legionellaceae bacterium]|nr:LbtU family siderophore porin [Legionellaceae bacterium]
MKHKVLLLAMMLVILPEITYASDEPLQQQIQLLQQQAAAMQAQLNQLQKQLVHQSNLKADHQTYAPVASQPAPIVKTAPTPVPLANQPPEPTISKQVKPKAKQHKQPTTRDATQPKIIQASQTTPAPLSGKPAKQAEPVFHSSMVSVHSLEDADPESVDFYPTALVADNHVLTYIAGTPVVSSPYLGSRPAFDGSDYIVNISSINRDIRLMQQRRSLDRAYEKMGYPMPNRPILAISGKVEPLGTIGQPYFGRSRGDWNLGSDELDIAAILNDKVEAYMGLAYNAAPPSGGGQRVSNSSIGLNMGFVNIGDLDKSPLYLTAGQLFAPFGRFSTSMVSPTLPMMLARTKARPVILGYKSKESTGLFAALYGFRSDTTLGSTGVGGVNLGYIVDAFRATTEVGVSLISSLDDAGGMQSTGSIPRTTFGGFSSVTNGNENVHKTAGIDAHLVTSFDRYNITLEWASSLGRFNPNDLSYNGLGALPQAAQVEGGITFIMFDRPSSVAASYQWSTQSLALNIPQHRVNAVYNISIWKDTVESLEYRHDIDYNRYQFANGAAPNGLVNANTIGTGGKADTLLAQIGIYF